MRVSKNPEDIGRCGCGRRVYCDGSHGLTEAEWQEARAKELKAARTDAQMAEERPDPGRGRRVPSGPGSDPGAGPA
jgi:hypothetical protein